MERDQYIAFKSRADIVAALIGRLEKVEINDIQLIPALQGYVEDGNKDRFEDYRRWHFVMDEPQRCAKVEEAEKKAKIFEERQNAADTYIEKLRERVEEYEKAYLNLSFEIDDFVKRCGAWGENVLSLGKVVKFQKENALNSNKNIYIEYCGEVRGVSDIFLNGDNKVVLRTTKDSIKVPPVLYRPFDAKRPERGGAIEPDNYDIVMNENSKIFR